MALTPRNTPTTIQMPFRRRRSFLSDVGQMALHPRTFYLGLRQSPVWGMAAVIILALITLAEVQALNTTAPATPVDTWAAALVAIARVVFGWILLAILLSEVSLFNGESPQLGLNWRVAVWASLPLGFMAGLQMLYRSGGGVIGAIRGDVVHRDGSSLRRKGAGDPCADVAPGTGDECDPSAQIEHGEILGRCGGSGVNA